MVAEILRGSRSLLHLTAEMNPLLRLAGLAYPANGTDSDRLEAVHAPPIGSATRELLDDELGLDAGQPSETTSDEAFAAAAAWRLAVQWPNLDFDPVEWADRILDVLARVRRAEGWANDEVRDQQRVVLEVLSELRSHGYAADPRYYDLPNAVALNEHRFPVDGPPGDTLIEEPPFVFPRVWQRANSDDLQTKALVIKTPSNAYRLEFLRALFPSARLRVLHLTRNPAASINGLFDGWRYHGFHAHQMATALDIPDYTDHRPADRSWWKFDLPPGWRSVLGGRLVDVCAFQWSASHHTILNDSSRVSCHYLRMPFEDLLCGPAARVATFRRVCQWLDIPFEAGLRRRAAVGIDPVAATAQPRAGRWRERERMIMEVVDAEARCLAKELGYGSDAAWI